MPTKVYSYGVYRLPPEVEKSLADMMYAAHRYYNLLVEVENLRRANLEVLRVAMSPEVATAQALVDSRQAALDAALKACQDYKAKSRETVASEPLRDAVTVARGELRKAWEARRLACKVLHATAEWKAAQKAEQDAHHDRQKAAYNGSSVWWGTKLAVGEDVERAAHDTKFGPVRFRRWTRNGRLSAQIQKGMSCEDVMAGEDARVRVARVAGKKKRASCHLRLASDEKKKPVWTELPIAMHRDLPPGGVVKWVHLVRRQGWHYYPGRDRPPAPHDKWYVHFVVVTPDEPIPEKPGMTAIDVGWRLRPDGSLRVAYWVDDRGREGEFALPPDLLALWDRRSRAQAERDLLFNNTRDRLADWIDANRESLTDEFLEATQTVRQWRGYNRLHMLLARMNDLVPPQLTMATFPLFESMTRELLEWQREDVRLETVFVTSGRKAEWRRKWLYQNFAAAMGQTYGTVGVENLNVADMRKDKAPETDEASRVQVGYRNAASVGLLLECVAANGRSKVIRFDCRRTTIECHRCGSVEDVDKAKLFHTCLGCGAEWDQDANAAHNGLSRMQPVLTDGEQPGDGGSDGPDRPTDGDSGQAVMPDKVVKKIPKRRRKPALSQSESQNAGGTAVA